MQKPVGLAALYAIYFSDMYISTVVRGLEKLSTICLSQNHPLTAFNICFTYNLHIIYHFFVVIVLVFILSNNLKDEQNNPFEYNFKTIF